MSQEKVAKNFHGVVPDLTNEEHHATTALGSTQIKEASKSLAHFRALMNGFRAVTQAMQKSFDLGTCAHAVILEQTTERFIVLPEDAPRRPTSAQVNAKKPSPETLVQIEWWQKFDSANDGKITVDPETYEKIKGAFDSFCAHPIAAQMVSDSKCEQSYFTVDEQTGLWVKARPDGFCQSDRGNYIFDYKTTGRSSARPADFARQVASLGYDLSACHYMAVTEAVTGKRPDGFYWIVQEMAAPFAISIFQASDEMLLRAEQKRRSLLNQIAVAETTGDYPAYSNDVVVIDIPKWAIENENDSFGEAV
jgi:hypothetical protein